MDFPTLWIKLQSAGWVEKHGYEYPKAIEILGKDLVIDGVHRFKSKKGLKCYIDK